MSTPQSNRTALAIRKLQVAISHAQEAVAELRDIADLRGYGGEVQTAVEKLTAILSRLETLKAERDTEDKWRREQAEFKRVYGPLIEKLSRGEP
jgi:site-specific recombinase